MQIEFHYYITYILARQAVFTKQDSHIIAYASQYTDDNCNELVIDRGTPTEYKNLISQTMDIFKPQKTRLKIYPCFHFVPGDVNSESAKRKDGRTHPYSTTPNSKNARTIIDSVFASGNLFHMGVCIHCYADTWAHQNFVGCDDDFNSCMGLIESFIPNIGHADAQYNPDIPSLTWEDKRLINPVISNRTGFLDAAREIFSRLFRFANKDASESVITNEWQMLNAVLSLAMGKESPHSIDENAERIELYCEIAKDMNDYDQNEWFNSAIQRKGILNDILISKPGFQESNWFKFQEAVKVHQKLAWDTVLPQIGEFWNVPELSS